MIASDNLAGFGSSTGLSQNATNWIVTFLDVVIAKTEKVDKGIAIQMRDCFEGASYLAPLFDQSHNIVFDSHVYYFAAAGTYSQFVLPAVCGQAAYLSTSKTKFPTVVGEWSLQVMFNNTYAGRRDLFDTEALRIPEVCLWRSILDRCILLYGDCGW